MGECVWIRCFLFCLFLSSYCLSILHADSNWKERKDKETKETNKQLDRLMPGSNGMKVREKTDSNTSKLLVNVLVKTKAY